MAALKGFLTLKISGLLQSKTYANHWCMLYSGKGSIPPRLDVFANQDNTDHSVCKKSLDIVDAKWVPVESLQPSFCFTVKGKRFLFLIESEKECALWRQALCCVSRDLFNSDIEQPSMSHGNEVIMQDNVLYSSANSFDESMFDVYADDHQGDCHRYGLTGSIMLKLEEEIIKVFLHGAHSPRMKWEYKNIRSYGHSANSVNISMGSQSSTGRATFSFLTQQGDRIVCIIQDNTQKLKNRESGGGRQGVAALPLQHPTQPPRRTPAPAPPPHTNPPGHRGSIPNNDRFKEELGKTIIGKNNSNESVDKKTQKSREKDKKKEEKEERKKEKERQKQEKQRQEKERQEREKQEKEKQKSLKKEKNGSIKEDTSTEAVESYYAEAEDLPSDINPLTHRPPIPVAPRPPAPEEEIYNKPWEVYGMANLVSGIQGGRSQPATASLEVEEDVYAVADKEKSSHTANGYKNMPFADETLYEDVGPTPAIPLKTYEQDTNSNDDVYDHFPETIQNTVEVVENVYGMGSAKPLNS